MSTKKMNQLDMEWKDYANLIKQTTENLKQLNYASQHMRYQFDYPDWYNEFVEEMDIATKTWISSHC